ncbi:MAG TPA: MerR family transcriptional regulator [Thermoanaerobaculia bacterium]
MAQEFYKAAEACKIAEVAPYVLRYWETEFPVLSEGKEKSAARQYSQRDVKIIARIRELLYDEGFTVAGAKKRLDAEVSEGRFDDGQKAPPPAEQRKAKEPARAASAPAASASDSAVATFLAEPSAKPASSSADSMERKKVVRELKEIVKILDRGRRK